MKISLLIGLAFTLGGCGLKMVNKEDTLQALTKAHAEVVNARTEWCSQYVTDKIDNTAALLNSLIQQFE